MARDLQKALQIGCMQEALSHMLLPIATSNGPQLASHIVFLPHRFFAALWEADQEAFLKSWCGGSPDALEEFWEALKGTKLYVKAAKMGLKRTIPIKIFGGRGCSPWTEQITGANRLMLTSWLAYWPLPAQRAQRLEPQ